MWKEARLTSDIYYCMVGYANRNREDCTVKGM